MGHNAAIILAAGLSSRSASFKPLMPLGDGTIISRVISIFQKNDIDVHVVVGHRQGEVIDAIKNENVDVIGNPDYAKGMFTSVQAGVRSLGSDCDSLFIMPVDIPLVRPETIALLAEEAEKCPGKIIYPVFEKRHGHPPLIPSGMIPSILGWGKDGGLKAVLSAPGSEAVEIAVPDGNILFDVDTPEDYEELLSRFQHIQVPTNAECDAILDICKVPPDIRQHSQKVAEVAVLIGRALNKSSRKLDEDIVRAAAMLHDIAKGRAEHDSAGGKILANMGFGYIADIVAVHTELGDSDADYSLETKIIYLADKFVNGTTLVTVESRYQSANNKFAVTPEIEANIARRKARALAVKDEFELSTGGSLDKLILGSNDATS